MAINLGGIWRMHESMTFSPRTPWCFNESILPSTHTRFPRCKAAPENHWTTTMFNHIHNTLFYIFASFFFLQTYCCHILDGKNKFVFLFKHSKEPMILSVMQLKVLRLNWNSEHLEVLASKPSALLTSLYCSNWNLSACCLQDLLQVFCSHLRVFLILPSQKSQCSH